MTESASILNDHITPAEQKALIDAASLSPSGDNCQPFRYAWDANQLSVYHLQDAAEHFLNFDNMGSRLSLGCLIENVHLKASQLGFQIEFQVREPLDMDSWVAQFTLVKTTAIEPDRLAHLVTNRYTDRRKYKGTTLPETFFNTSKEEAYGNSKIHVSTPGQCAELIQKICFLDHVIWTIQQAHKDLYRWLRLSNQETQLRDGMPWQTLGIGQVERAILRAGRNWNVQKFFNATGGLTVTKNVLAAQIKSSGYLCLITNKSSSNQDVIDVGRTSLRLWLDLVGANQGVQPLSLVVFLINQARLGRLPNEITPRQRKTISAADRLLVSTFGLEESCSPIWMFRTGAVPKPSLNQRSPRYPYETLIHKA